MATSASDLFDWVTAWENGSEHNVIRAKALAGKLALLLKLGLL
jgi:hypothetical protein